MSCNCVWCENQRRNPTTPLPESLEKIALMTKEEFLETRNPGDKFHQEGTYDSDLESMNYNYGIRHVEDHRSDDGIFSISQLGDYFILRHTADRFGPSKLVGIINRDTLYYENPTIVWRLPKGYIDGTNKRHWVSFGITHEIRVKYLDELMLQINDPKERNLKKYPHLYQRILVLGENYQVRFEKEPALNKGISIVIMNAAGEAVAKAQDEWGATLIMVASEYRRRGLGKLIGRIWYRWNPGSTSGGFTPAGRRNAIAMWEDHVREFRANGWYSELIRQGHLDKNRVREILSGLSPSKKLTLSVSERPEKQVMVYIEGEDNEEFGPAFVIYDLAFFDEEDDRHIYGFGFFRDSSVGSFLYTIDYDRGFQKLATYVALQMARDNQERIYIGSGYGDMLELEGLDHIQLDGDYAYLTEDVLDLGFLRRAERKVRASYDSYDEKYIRLLEMAHSKWS